MESILQQRFVEIDKQPNSGFGETQVGLKLLEVNFFDLFHRFQLNDHLGIDNNIGSETESHILTVPLNLNSALALNFKPELFQFISKYFLVDRLQKTWPKIPMNLDTTIQNDSCDFVFLHLKISVSLLLCVKNNYSKSVPSLAGPILPKCS